MRNGYGCHSVNVGSSKRGDTSHSAPLIVQDGYTFVFKGANGAGYVLRDGIRLIGQGYVAVRIQHQIPLVSVKKQCFWHGNKKHASMGGFVQ